MARSINRLTAIGAARLEKPGLYSDGGGLYLQITAAGVKSWLLRYMRNGRARGMGLGPLHTISLAEARAKALACRQQLLEGIDPLEAKSAAKIAEKLSAANSITFDQCADAYIAAHQAGWRNAKHADQWTNTLRTYASPVFGTATVSLIDTPLVLKVLEPIWQTKTETATRVRGRIESILDWATVRGYRTGENPARWKGHLDHLLPKRSKVQRVKHHPALPYKDAPAFFQTLRAQSSNSQKALAFLILTATRTNETIGAQWKEIDLSAGTWTIPAERMKAGKEHRVPLSKAALELLHEARTEHATGDDYVFVGQKVGRPLSNMAFLQLLKRMNRGDITAHGFRSTFRDWVGETTAHAREIAEAALAHTIKDKSEAAYARGDLFMKRLALMDDWATFLLTQ
ncbi:MAG: tyrosine-type recombinase/integrase [Achromobacter sp.]|uniref:tyrosine-type recombinase/integrase n=1 Tax=Achromobacter sp. TaxID=134375 RepID=UPI003CFCA0AC